ncbi:hypothetical protein GCM10010402_38520 [Actinomadura luteofluorescens]|uniref:hypothetical protein n=1 Tax=Actinomadura luteofluorescens TaxID=46163 RepID=UPI002164C820|nr:hypothetical protein [Actinomadura glauciflava]MCR3740268.1 hypothetical protein [Actinomadura glauciflava]
MSHLPPATAELETADTCLIFELCALIDATAKLDEKPRARHEAEQKVITIAHRVAAAAGPILDGEAALITALRDAAAVHPPTPESCSGCHKMNGARCGHHIGSTEVAETYHELGQALSGPSYTDPANGPADMARLTADHEPAR